MSNNDSTQDRAEGLGNEAKGRVEQGVGGLTGDRNQQTQGAVDEGKGTIQQGVGDLKDKLTGQDK